MPPKADKLSQTIESLQLFLDRKADEREDLADISRQLAQLNKTLSYKKLTLQIVSEEPALAQAVFDLINAQKELKRFFQLKFDGIPKTPEQTTPKQCASLKLRQHLENSTGLQQYIELDSNHEYSIGRSPESDVTIDGKLYQGVSWSHAAILPLAEGGEATQWQICDRSSTNGTFLNGKQVKDCQGLNSGDTVTLACPQTGQGVVEFTFSLRVESPDVEGDQEYRDIVDCDLLLVVVHGKQPLTQEIKEFLVNLDNTFISKQFLVADTPDPKQDAEAAKNVDANLKELEAWSKKEFELVPLYLQPYYKEGTELKIDIKQQKKQDRFLKILETTVKRQPENILAKRIAVKVVRVAEPIEPVLEQQQETLSQQIAKEQKELEVFNQNNLKEVSKKAIAEANQNKDKFFKQVKLDVSQSKAALLDIYSKRSIIYRIQDFVDNLNPVILNKNGQKIIQLKDDSNPDSDDINTSLVEFCTSSLETWTTDEWQRICHSYDNGGLNNLIDRLDRTINIIPDLLSESPFTAPDDIDVQDKFQMSFAGTDCQTTHKQKSLAAYVMKQLRSQMMQIMMMLTLILGFVGIKSNKGQMTGKMSETFQQYPLLFGLFICAIIFLLVNAYNGDNDLKLEEAGKKLKKDLASYYQSFTKNLLDKVIQDITLALELEDKKISNGLDLVDDAYTDHMIDVEKKQVEIKNNLEKYKDQQKNLSNELSEFEKLKMP